ncbi:hypothetical protein RB195_026506 [Necator americanus]|uniref:Uncharacterized protein n=1 Tax=Necator americanus TaxID=51031 RepID=A0ABR1EWY0_NECAM
MHFTFLVSEIAFGCLQRNNLFYTLRAYGAPGKFVALPDGVNQRMPAAVPTPAGWTPPLELVTEVTQR